MIEDRLRAMEAHLDLVVHEQDIVFFEDLLQVREIFLRRDHVASRALYRFDIERAELRLTRLRIEHAVVFGLEKLLELLHAVHAAVGIFLVVRAAVTIRIRHELRAVRKWP